MICKGREFENIKFEHYPKNKGLKHGFSTPIRF